MVMNGRRRPYTEKGIRRLPCARCDNAASYQWQICADGNLYRTICNACDDELNELVLKFFGFKDRARSGAALPLPNQALLGWRRGTLAECQ